MKIIKNKVVSFDYTLRGMDGEVIDISGNKPMVYLHGHNNLIPGLEKALEGKAEGDKFKVSVSVEEAYGEWDQDMVTTVSRSNFDGINELAEGMEFAAQFANGSQIVKVIKVTDDEVTLDGNHPLAGMDLNFEVKIIEIRDATEEEIARGGLEYHSENCDVCGTGDGCEADGCCDCHH